MIAGARPASGKGGKRVQTFLVSGLAGFAGFFVCMMVWIRVVRWVYSVWLVTRERRRNTAKRSVFRIIATLLLSSGPWALVLFVGFTIYNLSRSHNAAWNWFIVGALFALLFVAVNVALIFRRLRRPVNAKRQGV